MLSSLVPDLSKSLRLTKKPTRQNPYKITIVGDTTVGKSSIVERITRNRWTASGCSTIGAAFCSFRSLSGNVYHFWDTAGQERYQALVPIYLRGSAVVLIVFDITSESSFEQIQNRWVDFVYCNCDPLHTNNQYVESVGGSAREFDGVAENLQAILIGNKIDLEKDRTVSKARAQQLADDYGLHYFETSAKTGTGIEDVIQQIDRWAAEKQLLPQQTRRSVGGTICLEDDDNSGWGIGMCGGCYLM